MLEELGKKRELLKCFQKYISNMLHDIDYICGIKTLRLFGLSQNVYRFNMSNSERITFVANVIKTAISNRTSRLVLYKNITVERVKCGHITTFRIPHTGSLDPPMR